MNVSSRTTQLLMSCASGFVTPSSDSNSTSSIHGEASLTTSTRAKSCVVPEGFVSSTAIVGTSPSASSATNSTTSKNVTELGQAIKSETVPRVQVSNSSSLIDKAHSYEQSHTVATTVPTPAGITVPVLSTSRSNTSPSLEAEGVVPDKETRSPSPALRHRYVTRSIVNSQKHPRNPVEGSNAGASTCGNSKHVSFSASFPEDWIDPDEYVLTPTPESKRPSRRRRASSGKKGNSAKSRSNRNGHVINTSLFPFVLARFLRNAGASHPEVVDWNDDGKSFFIRTLPKGNLLLIGRLVAPYFTHSNYDALRRQLNLYGFQRLTEGP